ncbi:MAG: 3-dehydroquinate synthase [Opitutales bacterium]|jgi:3-dehydroquinate synthase|nr:3-dehydroquinate synthase [Opitutales bacterium]MBT5813789.1 3-dehydroquinate synthase [Opitutales bacterium]
MSDFSHIEYPISIPYQLRVYFTKHAFDVSNPLFRDLACSRESGNRRKVLFYVDEAVSQATPGLVDQIAAYFDNYSEELRLMGVETLHGGESLKNDETCLDRIYGDIENRKICRHSYIVAIGGGALLDTVGFAAATAHRGIRHFRFPTTTLGQADAGVGVKNGVNFNRKKNFVGAFAPPFAVINDFSFLETLPEVHLRNGYIEAIKVALIRDAKFFDWIEANAEGLNRFEPAAMQEIIHRCAEHHVAHIATSGDPFEMGSVRPLDFGHWAAHKLEQLSEFVLSHGEAVAIGIAIDTLYSEKMGYLDEGCSNRILSLLKQLNFETYSDQLERRNGSGYPYVLEGLEEFREHLGGLLTITLLKKIGARFEVHEMDTNVVLKSINRLKEFA